MDTTLGNKFCQFPRLRPVAAGNYYRVIWQTDRRLQQHWQRTFPPIAPQDRDQSQEAIIAQTLFQRRSPCNAIPAILKYNNNGKNF
ncbi:MAG: hypothetical protein VKL20_00185 [Synechocystis sp.]|nr:hypothetical protein [Synechocystis sp.]